MKQQSVGIVLCALLLTTFGHDLINRLRAVHSARLLEHGNGLFKQHQARDGLSTPDGCVLVCPTTTSPTTTTTPTTTITPPPTSSSTPTTVQRTVPTTILPPGNDGNSTIVINVAANLVGVYNESANVALVLDIKVGLVGVFDLSSTGGFIVDIQFQSVVQVSGLWQASVSFAVAFGVLASSGLQRVYVQGQVVDSAQYADFFQSALVVLSYGEYNYDASQSFVFLVSVSESLTESFSSVWSIIASGEFSAHLGLSNLVELAGGFADVISNIQDGIDTIQQYNVVFDLQNIFSARSSFEITGYIWQQLNATNIENIFGDLSNSTNLLRFIAGLGGNCTVGINGLVTLLLQVVLVANGQSSVDALNTVLIQYFSSFNGSVAAEWNAAVSGLYNQIVQLNLAEKLQGAVALLLKIQQGAWVEAGVNMSKIVSVAISVGEKGALTALATVLVLLQIKIPIELAIANLVLKFISLLVVAEGIQIVDALTGIQVGAQYLKAGADALVQILSGVSNTKIHLTRFGGIVSLLNSLPVIGSFIGSINAAFQAAGSPITVQEAFSDHVSFQVFEQIKGILVGAIKGVFGNVVPIIGGPVAQAGAAVSGAASASGRIQERDHHAKQHHAKQLHPKQLHPKQHHPREQHVQKDHAKDKHAKHQIH